MSAQEWLLSVAAIAPEIGLLLLTVVVIFIDRAVRPTERRNLGLIAAWGSFAVLLLTAGLWLFFNIPAQDPQLFWGGMVNNDLMTFVFRLMFLIAVMLTALISADVPSLQRSEYYALLFSATIGFSLMAAGSDLIMLYLALETASISLYVLANFQKGVYRSSEAGVKYFIYGAFASAVMLYGLSWLYGMTGQTNIYLVARAVLQQPDAAVLLAGALALVGFGFKISVVPYHFWAPDVYEGAPAPVSGLVSTASKAAGFALLLRVIMAGVFGTAEAASDWWSVLVAMCIVTMTLGNLLAIQQTNVKRLLAYSSIAQAGYALMGLVTLSVDGSAATMYYLLYYVLTNIAAFGVVMLFSMVTGTEELKDMSGLSRRSPWLALVMLFALLSLGGIPPTAGFFGKFFIFRAAVEAGLWWLAAIGILNALIALYYYLSVAKYMYLYRSPEDSVPIPVPRAAWVALGLTTFGILYLGLVAQPALQLARNAALALFVGS
ncbi:MAG: NADH-quinone oxidoreductase subunit N [Candidatus Promineifilaceae bacterium]